LGFVDLHSHVLCAIDDGAPDEAASMSMLAGLAALGFDTVCATPHQRHGMFMPSAEAIDTAHRAALDGLRANGIALRLPLGAENMWDAVFLERARSGTIPSYEGGPAFLFEVPVGPILPEALDDELAALARAGRRPVMAHPERYPPIFEDLDLDRAREIGRIAALAVDLGAVAGYHGDAQCTAARALLEGGIAHAVATDIHASGDVRVAAEGMAWIERRLGQDRLVELLDIGPRRILRGELP
jgi:protein-tyrosine phosphatase